MFIRTVSSISCAVAVLAAASMAQAQTFKPNGASFTIVDSEFIVEQTQQLSCDITGFTGDVASDGSDLDIYVDPTLGGPGLCGFVGLNTDWTVTPTGGLNVLISGISAASLLGTCTGSVTGYFLSATSTEMEIPRQNIPGTVNTPTGPVAMDCWIEGWADFGSVTLSTP